MNLEKIEDRLAKATEHSGRWYLSETEHGLGIFRDPEKYEPFYPIVIAEIADPDIAEFLCFVPEDTRSLINRVQRLEQELEAVKALHRPAHAVFSWNTNGARYEDPCPECHGAPGVHPCGCWADTQIEYVCAECHRLGSGSRGVYDYVYPCPTMRALDGEPNND